MISWNNFIPPKATQPKPEQIAKAKQKNKHISNKEREREVNIESKANKLSEEFVLYFAQFWKLEEIIL